ncbi:aromatic acid decarboxylase, partial [Klebsiella michiganensis]
VTHSVNRALDLFDLQVNNIPRWGEGELRFN